MQEPSNSFTCNAVYLDELHRCILKATDNPGTRRGGHCTNWSGEQEAGDLFSGSHVMDMDYTLMEIPCADVPVLISKADIKNESSKDR